MKTTSISKISFNELNKLFNASSDNVYQLYPEMGAGTLHSMNLEKGLKINIWDCVFEREVELYNESHTNKLNHHFTLAYILDKNGLNYIRTKDCYKKNLWWDNIFLSALTDYAICFLPKKRFYCVSLNFSYNWLINVLENNASFNDLIVKLSTPDNLNLFGKIEPEELEQIKLLKNSTTNCRGSFFIKSGVLKIISDFFLKLKQQNSFFTGNPSSNNDISEVAAYLDKHFLDPLPNLKSLAHKFSLSESTLKRRFKKHFGISISTYFYGKKLEIMHPIEMNNENQPHLIQV